jgi:hypothetical protein
LYYHNDRLYLKIYSFFRRKEILYILTNKHELEKPHKIRRRKINDNIIYDFTKEDKDTGYKIWNIIFKITAALLIVLFLFSYFPVTHFLASYSYKEFLSKKYSFEELFYAVSSRIDYQSDFDDLWNTPLYAWNKKKGDCEEMASIISDYLHNAKIENYLAGLNIKNSRMGHAVVFAKINNNFYIIDPTRAIESSGTAKINKAETLKEAILKYSSLPVYIYKVPSFEGEKSVAEIIE